MEELSIMKKTVIASSLAVTLGLTGYALTNDHSAHASEQTTNYSHLADLAQNNPSELNAHPVQAGAYNISFVKDGFKYNFTSNGNTWSWNYTYTGGADTAQSTTDYTESYNQASTQSVSSNNQASTSNVKAVSAPVQRTSSYNNYSARTTSYSAPKTTSYSTASTGGSVKAQFLANGGTEAAWNAIVMPESGGNPNAVNPIGYRGLGQTKEAWGTGSVATQTQGMANYAKSRYGSWDAAIAFRQGHGWW